MKPKKKTRGNLRLVKSEPAVRKYPFFKAHPWHGVSAGPDAPRVVHSYVEIVPSDTIKYEVDKESGHLFVDRPQRYSSQCPALYGFVPQTYCSSRVSQALKEFSVNKGDGDPLDICILTDRVFTRGDFVVRAIPIGGFRVIDKGEADDKIIAVLEADSTFGSLTDISEVPNSVVDRLRHYFLTYKLAPGSKENPIEMPSVYGQLDAQAVVEASLADYRDLLARR